MTFRVLHCFIMFSANYSSWLRLYENQGDRFFLNLNQGTLLKNCQIRGSRSQPYCAYKTSHWNRFSLCKLCYISVFHWMNEIISVSSALNIVPESWVTGNSFNKKYVLWNTGICPIASKVGHMTLASGHAPFGVIHRPLCSTCHGLSNKEKMKSLASSV